MQSNPELKGLDKTRLTNTYNTIHMYAPEFTADPIMGGSLLKSVYDAGPGMDHVMVRELIGSRKNLQDTKHNQFRMGPMPTFELPRKADYEKEQRQEAFQTKMEDRKQTSRNKERFDDAMAERANAVRDAKLKIRGEAAKSVMRKGLESNKLTMDDIKGVHRTVRGHDRLVDKLR
jgi:hypothetical protein